MEKYQAVIANKSTSYPDINWTDFNFPPCIKLMHFSLSELQPPYHSLVRLLYICYLIIFAETIFNIISAIAMASIGYPGITVFYAFLNFILFNSVQLFVFYRGYKGICKDIGLLKLYKIFQILLAILWLILSIVGGGSFIGFTTMSYFQEQGLGGMLFLSIVQSLLFLVDSLLCTYCVFRVHNFREQSNENI